MYHFSTCWFSIIHEVNCFCYGKHCWIKVSLKLNNIMRLLQIASPDKIIIYVVYDTPLKIWNVILFSYLPRYRSSVLLAYWYFYVLTHWGRVTHICVSKLSILGSDDGLSPGRRQAIIWTNAGILLIGPLGTNFNEISIGIQTFSFKQMRIKISSAKWRPSCLGLNVLISSGSVMCILIPWRNLLVEINFLSDQSPVCPCQFYSSEMIRLGRNIIPALFNNQSPLMKLIQLCLLLFKHCLASYCRYNDVRGWLKRHNILGKEPSKHVKFMRHIVHLKLR